MNNRDITVLVVEAQVEIRELYSQVITPFANVLCASTVAEALRMLPATDILILDWLLQRDQDADPILDAWMQDNGGPCCVISGNLPRNVLYEMFARGVYNAFEKPVPMATITAVVRHYVQDVRMARQLKQLSTELSRLRRNMLLLAIILAAVAGPEIVKYVGMILM